MDDVDLRVLFRALGGFSGVRALESSPIERTKAEEQVDLLDAAPSKITASPLDVAAFVDGIQASLCLTHFEHRPVYLSYVAAAAVGHGSSVKGLRERLLLQSAQLDVPFLESLNSGVPIGILPFDDPPSLEREAQRTIGSLRDQMERRLVTDMLEEDVGRLVLDGSLLGREHDVRLVGVVKTSAHQWLDDESCLYGLPEGWRSPRFSISEKGGRQRYSCYVQMVDKSRGPWNQGLIRLEAFDAELLDSLAALALTERQGSHSGDRRWDRHMAGVRAVEDYLRARRPSVFSL
jgi:hypothetical protein